MGCQTGKCLGNTNHEIEVNVDEARLLYGNYLSLPKSKKNEPSIYTKDNNAKNNSQGTSNNCTTNNGIIMNPQVHSYYMKNYLEGTKEVVTQHTNYKSTASKDSRQDLFSNSPTKSIRTYEIEDILLRMGKTYEELLIEFDMMGENIKEVIDSIEYIRTENINSCLKTMYYWREEVYDIICKKTGEIKTYITNSSNGKQFMISHEIVGWKNIQLIKSFYQKHSKKAYSTNIGATTNDNNGNDNDERYNQIKSKMETLPTLTICIWLQLVLEPEYDFSVGYNFIKPSDKPVMSKFLELTTEKSNLMKWLDISTATPIEYGCGFYNNNSYEIIAGFYFFDGTPAINLSKSLSAFKSYGADLNTELLSIFKNIEAHELKILFLINEDGVQKIKLLVYHMSNELESIILQKVDKNYVSLGWNKFKNKFYDINLSKYFLEFSTDGFSLSLISEVGQDYGSKVYLDTNY